MRSATVGRAQGLTRALCTASPSGFRRIGARTEDPSRPASALETLPLARSEIRRGLMSIIHHDVRRLDAYHDISTPPPDASWRADAARRHGAAPEAVVPWPTSAASARPADHAQPREAPMVRDSFLVLGHDSRSARFQQLIDNARSFRPRPAVRATSVAARPGRDPGGTAARHRADAPSTDLRALLHGPPEQGSARTRASASRSRARSSRPTGNDPAENRLGPRQDGSPSCSARFITACPQRRARGARGSGGGTIGNASLTSASPSWPSCRLRCRGRGRLLIGRIGT